MFRPSNLHGLLLGGFETIGHIVQRLELSNGILGDASDLRLKVLQLRLVREAILQFSVGGQQTSSVRLQLTLLAAHAVLNSEPEDLKERIHASHSYPLLA